MKGYVKLPNRKSEHFGGPIGNELQYCVWAFKQTPCHSFTEMTVFRSSLHATASAVYYDIKYDYILS